jgi:arabinogalactan endo-1,4-beta-galactosidase
MIIRKFWRHITMIVMCLFWVVAGQSQSFYFGADLSYVNEMEDCGAIYTVKEVPADPYLIFKSNNTRLVRLRLWHTPSWYDNLNQGNRYSDMADVRKSIMRAKELAMDVLLDFHLSDNWADPAHQVAPAAWSAVLDELPVLQDSLYNYIHSTLMQLAADDLLPEIVQIGNETNKGILQSQAQNDAGWWLEWSRNTTLFNTAIDAVRDVEAATGDSIKIAIHIADPADVAWFIEQFHLYGVTDFDIIGISYYGSYHPVSISSVGNTIASLKENYPEKEVMILETAYPWTTAGNDSANNVLSGVAGYPPSPANQRLWMIFLTQTVISSGGAGVVYWEPGWVSTPCHTQWAQGSHWENATFFDFDNEMHEGLGWMTYQYDFSTAVQDAEQRNPLFAIYGSHGMIFIKQHEGINYKGPLRVEVFGLDGRGMNIAGPKEFGSHSSAANATLNGSVANATLNEVVLEKEFSPGVYVVIVKDSERIVALKKIVLIQ